ncbi:MAG: YeeE/YedE thiosulfate transporter family protein [Methylococcales bacterium]|nr:YeeE/YedE thiosulfate transporter family protein [Methylococcales bacterium]
MKTNIIALLSGIIFGIGLSLSQMINPNKVLNFLDITGDRFDPSLIFVMVGALSVAMVSFKWIRKLSVPLFGQHFQLAKNTIIDKPLIIGGVIFGIGWGMTGYCPGPVVAGLGLFSLESVIVIAAICVGFFAYNALFERNH